MWSKKPVLERSEGNWSVVRRLVGYDRYTSREAYDCLDLLYVCLHDYVNFFQPSRKLVSKTRHGAKVHKVYDTAMTPYQRVLQSGGLTPQQEGEFTARYRHLNPVQLLRNINGHLEKLWKLAARPRLAVQEGTQPTQGGSYGNPSR